MKKILIFILLLTFSFVGRTLAVPITSNLDAALTGATVIDFESATQGTYTSISIDGVTFTANNNHLMIDDSYQYYNMSGIYLDNGTYSNNGFQSLTIDFATDTSAFGFNWGMAESWATWTLSAYDSSNNLIESMILPSTGPSSAGEFFGIAASGISHAMITQSGNQDFDWIGLDNLTYVADAPVPEPGTMLLFGIGLLGLAGMNRRKK